MFMYVYIYITHGCNKVTLKQIWGFLMLVPSSHISLSLSLLPLSRHWLTSSYILFAVPYFIYDIYAMFLCHWYKLQVKDHEEDRQAKPMRSAIISYLRREFLMVLHHVVMVTVCFPVSVVSGMRVV